MNNKLKTFLLLSFFLQGLLPLQSQINLDSLQTELNKSAVDRNILQFYLDKMQSMKPNETDAVKIIGDWLIKKTDTDSLQDMLAAVHLALGKTYVSVLNFEEAARYLTNAQNIAEKNNYFSIRADVLNELGTIYDRNEQTERANVYYEESLEISEKNNYQRGIAFAKYNLGRVQLERGSGSNTTLNSAISLMLQGFSIVKKLNDRQGIITQSSSLVQAYTALKNYDSASMILEDAEKLIKESGKEAYYIQHYNRVAKIYNARKKYNEAIKYYNLGLNLAKKYNIPRWKCMYYDGLATTYERMGDYKNANLYNQLNIRMHDALVSKENFAAAADIQNSYERTKKDNEILKLAAANKQRSTLNKILIASTIGLLLLSFLGYMNFKSRNKIAKQQEQLQNQKIAELEKDKQLLAIDAMLRGQEEERSRIAKDLHDGLGGLLSGTKLSFMNIKENLVLTKENAALFDKSLSMLDNTIGDLRKVAHNLMPEALVKFGLHEALRDFCDAIESSSGIRIVFQQFGEKRKLTNTAEVFIYRIIQELVNNAVKHAEAERVIIQLAMNPDKTGITVEDDGKGFDKNSLSYTRGAGMANINYRVQYFSGKSDIVSSPGNGTSVHIELKA
jgi:two-component system, NarL family, sensor kinase